MYVYVHVCAYMCGLPPFSHTPLTHHINKTHAHTQLFGRFRPPLRLGLLPYKMQGIPRTANIITQPDAEVFGLKCVCISACWCV
jgi:hypothetical protein